MPDIRRKSFRAPDEHVAYPGGWTDEVHLGDLVVGRSRHEPGWRWSTHIKPIIGTPSCQTHHVGVVLGGRLVIRLDDGTEVEFGPDDAYDIPPGHDGWVVGDEPSELLEWSGVHGWASPPSGERVLATLLFTDIVGSTPLAERLGDRAWTRLVEDHDAAIRRVLERFRGREVDTTGDGMFAMFDGAERCVRAAVGIGPALDQLGLTIRAGVHTGEVEIMPGGGVRGVAVHATARIMALAQPSEILVSATTRELVAAATDLTFEDRGLHALKGVSGERQLFAVTTSAQPGR